MAVLVKASDGFVIDVGLPEFQESNIELSLGWRGRADDRLEIANKLPVVGDLAQFRAISILAFSKVIAQLCRRDAQII